VDDLQYNYPGFFFVFEGIDGSGKSTQCKELAVALRNRGYKVIETREPTDGPWGKKIRELARAGKRTPPKEELELFVRDRKEHIKKLILPSLELGKIIIQDRYYFSSTAYQGSRGLDPQKILESHRAFAPQPTRTFLLGITAEEGLKRIRTSRSLPPDAFEKLNNLQKCVALFNDMEDPSLIRIDGTLPPEELHRQILAEALTLTG